MARWVENYEHRLTLQVAVVMLVGFGLVALVWRAVDVMLSGAGWLNLTLKGSSTLVILLLAAVYSARLAAAVPRTIASAVEHMSAKGGEAPPPQENSVSNEVVKQIYELASLSQKLTTNLDDQRAFLSSAVDLLPVGIYIFNSQQELMFTNAFGAKLLRHDGQELIGLPVAKVLDWVFQTDEAYDVWLEQSRGAKIRDQRFWQRVSIILSDNHRLIGDVAAAYEKRQSADIETVVVFIDRTDEYTADESQLDFVAVAAHELRGPITVIRGYLDVFNQEMAKIFNVEQRSLLQKMTVNAEMLSLYVNNILNVARLDQQELKLHIVKADWKDIVNEAYGELLLRAQARGRVLLLKIDGELSPVGVDRVSILEVVNNLVDNAIKYSDEGGQIVIHVSQRDGLVETTVQDFGIGIPSAILGNLFKKFYRSHRTRRGVSGTGLGLYLSKAIIDAHGGNIWVRSKEGEGSTFGFDLPSYDTIADTLKAGDSQGDAIKRSSQGWIKNHAMTRR